ncbi:hypothetical protein BDQ17DRAFT_1426648 [Cyathus striatus]|nr:hypothetical protein BDQ17DRAFT_1426648 [Cyathus striatus]
MPSSSQHCTCWHHCKGGKEVKYDTYRRHAAFRPSTEFVASLEREKRVYDAGEGLERCACALGRRQRVREEKKEKKREYFRVRYQRNQEALKDANKKWRKKNSEAVKKANKKWREKNLEYERARVREYYWKKKREREVGVEDKENRGKTDGEMEMEEERKKKGKNMRTNLLVLSASPAVLFEIPEDNLFASTATVRNTSIYDPTSERTNSRESDMSTERAYATTATTTTAIHNHLPICDTTTRNEDSYRNDRRRILGERGPRTNMRPTASNFDTRTSKAAIPLEPIHSLELSVVTASPTEKNPPAVPPEHLIPARAEAPPKLRRKGVHDGGLELMVAR